MVQNNDLFNSKIKTKALVRKPNVSEQIKTQAIVGKQLAPQSFTKRSAMLPIANSFKFNHTGSARLKCDAGSLKCRRLPSLRSNNRINPMSKSLYFTENSFPFEARRSCWYSEDGTAKQWHEMYMTMCEILEAQQNIRSPVIKVYTLVMCPLLF